MKRWIVIVVGLATAALGGAALWNICSHRVVKSELSEVYNRYKDRSDLRVAFVKEYRIDDSTTVDVTTLTAKDSAGWEALLREMNVSDLIIEICNKAAKKGNYTVAFYNCKKNHPEQHTEIDIPNTDFVLYSYKEYTLYVFDITSRKQRNAIQTQRIKETFNN